MSDGKVRKNGWYLGRRGGHSSLTIYYIYNNTVAEMGSFFNTNSYHWITDEPLDLESIRLLMMNGGLENAVEVVNNDSSKTSSVLFLEKELKRYKDWYGDMDSLSR